MQFQPNHINNAEFDYLINAYLSHAKIDYSFELGEKLFSFANLDERTNDSIWNVFYNTCIGCKAVGNEPRFKALLSHFESDLITLANSPNRKHYIKYLGITIDSDYDVDEEIRTEIRNNLMERMDFIINEDRKKSIALKVAANIIQIQTLDWPRDETNLVSTVITAINTGRMAVFELFYSYKDLAILIKNGQPETSQLVESEIDNWLKNPLNCQDYFQSYRGPFADAKILTPTKIEILGPFCEILYCLLERSDNDLHLKIWRWLENQIYMSSYIALADKLNLIGLLSVRMGDSVDDEFVRAFDNLLTQALHFVISYPARAVKTCYSE